MPSLPKSALGLVLVFATGADAGTPIPAGVQAVLSNHCLECHDAESEKGDVNLDHASVDWKNMEDLDRWLRALDVVDQGLMPPEKRPRPSAREREVLLSWLDATALEHIPVGGTLPRRLNRAEYQATVRKLLNLRDFKLPLGFPKDNEVHGFDNVGEGLVLSPPLLEAYSKVATQVAEEIYPPAKPAPESTIRKAGPEEMVISFSASTIRDGALRLASRSIDIMRSCTWPSRMEILASGTYRISVSASTFKPKSEKPMILEVRARDVAASDRSSVNIFRKLRDIQVSSKDPESVTFEADLYEGQTLLFRWVNAEMDHDFRALEKQMRGWFEKDKRFLAAWQKAVFPHGEPNRQVTTALRGGNGWAIVKKHYADKKLDMSQATMDSKMTVKLLGLFKSNEGKFNYADALCWYYFENGPSLEIHEVKVEGPVAIVDGPKDRRRDSLQVGIMGQRKGGQSDEDFVRAGLKTFLPRAFRRPVDASTIESFLTIAREHWAEGHSFDEGMHLLLRNILISPRFLYRSLNEGPLDDFDLATRLSYFLTQGPPDTTLQDLARRGRLSPDWVLERESRRLLATVPTDPMVQSFTSQWLDLNLLTEIMPDQVFRFTPYYMDMARDEVEHFFAEMLRENRPMTDFIDPDFTYTSSLFAKEVYKLDVRKSEKESSIDQRRFRRVSIERGGRYGGLLGQSGIMMATANGVDTQPVLRGVWVLENILGTPPPEPPKNVPALTPDTRGATTPRELLAAHTNEPSCAGCHRRIDPIGFMLENFDPVGRWRTSWPKSKKVIDATGSLPDGTEIEDITDFKRWLVENIDQFSECLSEKLMIYATGRVLNYAEKKEVEAIVRANREKGNGFRDLVVALIQSKTFRAK